MRPELQLPPLRTFRVYRVGQPAIVVEGHGYSTTDGVLTIVDLLLGPRDHTGERTLLQMARRSFLYWEGIEEIMVQRAAGPARPQ